MTNSIVTIREGIMRKLAAASPKGKFDIAGITSTSFRDQPHTVGNDRGIDWGSVGKVVGTTAAGAGLGAFLYYLQKRDRERTTGDSRPDVGTALIMTALGATGGLAVGLI